AGADKVLTCSTTSVALNATASANTTLVWSPGGATTASIIVSNAGTYLVKATNIINGCTASDTVIVTQAPTPTASAVVGTILCNGGTTTVTVSATGGIAPYSGTGI